MSTAKGIGLRLTNEICEALRGEAVAGLKALRKRGAEVGGVLTERADSKSMIDGFEPIPSEHMYGPSYRLSPLDLEHFRTRCGELQESQRLNIAGFFRSSTREDLQVTAEDAALVRELLSDAAIIVLIRPFLSGDAIFRVFQRAVDGDWSEFEEFRYCADEAFVSRPAAAPLVSPTVVSSPVVSSPVVSSPVVSLPLIKPVVSQPLIKPAAPPVTRNAVAPATPETRALRAAPVEHLPVRPYTDQPQPRRIFAADWMKVLLIVSFLAFASALLISTRGMWNGAPPTARASSPDLAMQVAWQGDSLRLTWDRNLPSVRNATGGNLQIHDGKQYREVALDSTQVSQAVVYYTPGSDDVTFRLNIQGREPAPVAGIARVLALRPTAVSLPASNGPRAGSPAEQEARSTARREFRSRPEASASSPAPVSTTQPLRSGAEASPPAITPGVPNEPTVPTKPNGAMNAAVNPDEKKADASESRRPVETAPPALAPPKTSDPAPPLRAQNAPPVSAPPRTSDAASQLRAQNVPSTAPAIPPAVSIPQTTVAPKEPLQSGSRSASPPVDAPTPPRPLKKILPLRDNSAGPAVLTPMTVTVQVSIDKQGNVIEAHALRSPSQYWSGRAVAAALQWRFEPATLHGQKIPSTSEIDFRFNPR